MVCEEPEGVCGCIDHYRYACNLDGNVDWYNSCGARQGAKEKCSYTGYGCEDGQCVVKSHSSYFCYGGYDGDIYWHDSLGVREELKEECKDSAVCIGDDCVNNFPNQGDYHWWSDPSPSAMSHSKAISYCNNLRGFLPSILQLRGLVQNCYKSEESGACEVKSGCLSYACAVEDCSGCTFSMDGIHSVFGDTQAFWSSDSVENDSNRAWVIRFSTAGIGYLWKEYSEHYSYVRCVK